MSADRKGLRRVFLHPEKCAVAQPRNLMTSEEPLMVSGLAASDRVINSKCR